GHHLTRKAREFAQLQSEFRFTGLKYEVGKEHIQPPPLWIIGLGQNGPRLARWWEEETHLPFGVRLDLPLGLAFLLYHDSGIDQQLALRVGHLPHQERGTAQLGGGRQCSKGNPRVSFGFTIEMVRRGIASRLSWIIEIPQTGQAVLAAGHTL